MATGYVELKTRDQKWRREAVRLSRSQIPFQLAEFNARHDGAFYFALKKKFDLEGYIDFNTGKVYFLPRNYP